MDPPAVDDNAVLPWIKDGGRNRWRYKAGTDDLIIEIELTQNKVAEIDASRLAEVQTRKWNASKNKKGKYLWYAKTTIGNQSPSMHKILFPSIPALIDHIDGNGLNNTLINVRNGRNGVNERNRVHITDAGVFNDVHRKLYRATWYEFNGKREQQRFKWADYGGIEGAYIAAKACRMENANRAFSEIIAIQAEAPGGIVDIDRKTPPTAQSPKSGVKNLCYDRRPGMSERLRAEITINHIKYEKSWTVASFPTREDALSVGAAWIADLKAKHPKAPYKKRKVNVE